ncbi:MAG: ArsR family transcriptional regulator [Anaerolineales bacterium]|jgi:predicted ArsR family transcriptional regulator
MAKSTRQTILRTLRSQGKCTVKDLAKAAKVSPVSVRHHLSNLEAENLVAVEEVRHGVGRPRHIFSLTEDALELFPARYYRLANRLLGEMKDSLPEGSVNAMFSHIADELVEQFRQQLEGLPLEARMTRLAELLKDEGFEIEVEFGDGQVLIKEMTCPYLHVGREHPEVCLVDRQLIAAALELPVERISWLLEGDRHCTYAVQLKDSHLEVQTHD